LCHVRRIARRAEPPSGRLLVRNLGLRRAVDALEVPNEAGQPPSARRRQEWSMTCRFWSADSSLSTLSRLRGSKGGCTALLGEPPAEVVAERTDASRSHVVERLVQVSGDEPTAIAQAPRTRESCPPPRARGEVEPVQETGVVLPSFGFPQCFSAFCVAVLGASVCAWRRRARGRARSRRPRPRDSAFLSSSESYISRIEVYQLRQCSMRRLTPRSSALGRGQAGFSANRLSRRPRHS